VTSDILWQEPFNKVDYEMIGDDSAPTYFSVGKEQGEIKLRSGVNLKSDTETTYIVSKCNKLIFDLPKLKMYLDWKILQQIKCFCCCNINILV